MDSLILNSNGEFELNNEKITANQAFIKAKNKGYNKHFLTFLDEFGRNNLKEYSMFNGKNILDFITQSQQSAQQANLENANPTVNPDKKEKIMGMPKPVFIGVSIVAVIGLSYAIYRFVKK